VRGVVGIDQLAEAAEVQALARPAAIDRAMRASRAKGLHVY
jgi:hypothetical protein